VGCSLRPHRGSSWQRPSQNLQRTEEKVQGGLWRDCLRVCNNQTHRTDPVIQVRIAGYFKPGLHGAAYITARLVVEEHDIVEEVEFLIDTGASKTIEMATQPRSSMNSCLDIPACSMIESNVPALMGSCLGTVTLCFLSWSVR